MKKLKFWNQVKCRICFNLIKDCVCKPIPCPFCDSVFGFVQDWNIHLLAIHCISDDLFTGNFKDKKRIAYKAHLINNRRTD